MLTIELYTSRKEVLALRQKGHTDHEIATIMEVRPEAIARILNKDHLIDYRLSAPARPDDYGAVFPRPMTDEAREVALRSIVQNRVRKMGYHFSEQRFDQLYTSALRRAE